MSNLIFSHVFLETEFRARLMTCTDMTLSPDVWILKVIFAPRAVQIQSLLADATIHEPHYVLTRAIMYSSVRCDHSLKWKEKYPADTPSETWPGWAKTKTKLIPADKAIKSHLMPRKIYSTETFLIKIIHWWDTFTFQQYSADTTSEIWPECAQTKTKGKLSPVLTKHWLKAAPCQEKYIWQKTFSNKINHPSDSFTFQQH